MNQTPVKVVAGGHAPMIEALLNAEVVTRSWNLTVCKMIGGFIYIYIYRYISLSIYI